jgi:hypothetical protein
MAFNSPPSLDLEPLAVSDLAAPLEGAISLAAETQAKAVVTGLDAATGESGQGDRQNNGGTHTGHLCLREFVVRSDILDGTARVKVRRDTCSPAPEAL